MRCAPRASNGPNHLGSCALQIYTMRTVDSAVSEVLKVDLKTKFTGMQRRVSVAGGQ